MGQFTGRVSAVSLSAATAKTLVQLVPASNTPVDLVELGVSFNGVTATDVPVLVELLRQSTAGTSSALTLVGDREHESAAAKTTALQTFTAEPTAGNILRSWYVTPVGGLFVIQFPLDREIAALSNRLGLRCTAPSAETASGYLSIFE